MSAKTRDRISVDGLLDTDLLWSAKCGREVVKNNSTVLSNSSTVTGFVIYAAHPLCKALFLSFGVANAMRSTRRGALTLTTRRQSSAPISVTPAAFDDKSRHRDTGIGAALTQGLGASHMCRILGTTIT